MIQETKIEEKGEPGKKSAGVRSGHHLENMVL